MFWHAAVRVSQFVCCEQAEDNGEEGTPPKQQNNDWLDEW